MSKTIIILAAAATAVYLISQDQEPVMPEQPQQWPQQPQRPVSLPQVQQPTRSEKIQRTIATGVQVVQAGKQLVDSFKDIFKTPATPNMMPFQNPLARPKPWYL